MKKFILLNGVFSEKVTQEINENADVFQTKFINELNSHQLKHSNVDIKLEGTNGSTLKLSNKDTNPFIRNFEKKSAYLKINLISTGPESSELQIQIRPNSIFTILFFTHTTSGILMLYFGMSPDSIIHKLAPGGLVFILAGLSMTVFGYISKKNLYNSLMRVVNRVNKSV